MNPALSQTLYHIDYSLTGENKYSGSDRAFTNPAAFTTSDFPYISRKLPNSLNNNQLGQTLSVPTNAGLEYNPSSSSIPDVYHPSPPTSIDSSHAGSLQPISTTTPFDFSSKLATSNASSTDHFSNSISQFADPLWPSTMMPDYRRGPPNHAQMTPPLGYQNSNGISGIYGNTPNRAFEHYPPPLYSPRTFNGSEIHHGLFNNSKPTRSPTAFHQLPVPMSQYPLNTPYAHMQPHAAARPDGPPFEDTKVIHSLYARGNHQLSPEIQASIQKGFFQVEGKWTCYRRNYFTVSCAFSFKTGIPDGAVYLQRHSQLEPVQQYAVSISAKTANLSNQESEVRQLVQHTPKRDKATESVPGRHLVQPTAPQSLQSTGILPSASLFSGGHTVAPEMMSAFAYGSQNHMSVPTSYTFERIQFQKATANNGKRRAQQQFFHVVVELSVNVGRPGGDDNWVLVATRQSSPMVVRGRSPGHYKDNIRRDSQTNMDPDRSGGGGDGAPINRPMPPFMSNGQSSPMDWASSHRHNHHYGGSYSRLTCESDCSPTSAGSSSTLTRSPTGSDFHFADMVPSKIVIPYDFDRPVLSPISSHNRDITIGHDEQPHNKKPKFDDEGSEYGHEVYSSTNCTEDSFSQRNFECPAASNVKPLCAS